MTATTSTDRAATPGLRFGSDQQPGIRRRGTRRFSYVDERTGRAATAADQARIAALAVPPAWTDVWIAASPNTHVQATGRDAKGRKQYRYHPEFTASRSADKFAGLVQFAGHLGALRRQVRRDVRQPGIGHDRVIAVVVRLLDVTGLRVGNEEYARTNRTYGLTTLRRRHVAVRGPTIRLTFQGKVAKEFDVSIDDPTMARIVRRCRDLPGQELFTYLADDGSVRAVTSTDVNDYLSVHTTAGTTAKTFRTWTATVGAAVELADATGEPDQRVLNDAIDAVAAALGNTRAVCRASYVHPAVVETYLDGGLARSWSRPVGTRPSGLSADERRTLRIVRRRK